MLISNHVVAGTAIGRAFKRHPITALGLGLASHLMLDALPHWGVDKSRDDAHDEFLKVATRDGLVGLALGALALSQAKERKEQVAILFAVTGAVLPDLEYPAQHFLHVTSLFPKKFRQFHSRIQQHESSSRMPQEVLTIAIGSLALFAQSRYARTTKGTK